jgi:hypothetical protein
MSTRDCGAGLVRQVGRRPAIASITSMIAVGGPGCVDASVPGPFGMNFAINIL